MDREIWKDIKGYEGLYQISNLGRIKSLRQQKVMKITHTEKGYAKIGLWKNNIFKTMKVHRLVAQAFIPNPSNKKEINHINHIRDDNRVENLEWATREENMKGVACGNKKKKRVALFIDGIKVDEYDSILQASKITGINHRVLSYLLNPKNKRFEWKLI